MISLVVQWTKTPSPSMLAAARAGVGSGGQDWGRCLGLIPWVKELDPHATSKVQYSQINIFQKRITLRYIRRHWELISGVAPNLSLIAPLNSS